MTTARAHISHPILKFETRKNRIVANRAPLYRAAYKGKGAT